MAMELDSSKYEDGEVAGFEYGSPEKLYKEDKIVDFEGEKMDFEENVADAENGDGHDDVDLSLSKDKEKSRESGKHRNKDRRKGRLEEKDQKSKEREKLKERDKTHDASKEKAIREPETRDKDHISSRERRKEEADVHKDKERNKDKFREKDYDRNKHRDKDRERDEVRGREHERGKDRAKDRERDRETEKEHFVEKDYERGKEQGRDRDREMEKERSVERDYERGKERGRERDRDVEKERSIERDYERGKKRGRDRDRDMEKEHSIERDYERGKERVREREKDNERSKGRERDREKVDREWDRDRVKEKDREREKERDRTKEREREREEIKDWDRSEREKVKEKFKEKEKDKERDKYWEKDRDKERSKDKGRDKVSGKNRDEGYEISRGKERGKDEHLKVDNEDIRDEDIQNSMIDAQEKVGYKDEKLITESVSDVSQPSVSELQDCTRKTKEESLKKKSDGVSEVLSWVNKSRILEEKRNAEKEKALLLSKVFEEQDNIDQGDSEEEERPQHTGKDLGGVKILHGLDKVMEGGAVVLTLKDQNILDGGDINEEVDMLENVEINEQKQRDGAYSAAKKKTGIYTDKFSDDPPGSQKKILPQYDDPVEDEGVTLDESGRFSGEAKNKLEELRKRIQGADSSKHFDDLASAAKMSSDYYTQEEMLQFKKPKKKKSLRKREKLDLDALEAEAKSAGLGVGDLGSRNEGKRQLAREEQEKAEAEMRSKAYQAAYARAEGASKALRHEQTLTVKEEEDDNLVFGDEDEDLYRSMDQARKLALKKQVEEAASGPQAVALLAVAEKDTEDTQNPLFGDPHEKRLVFTEMEEFVSKIKLDEDTHKPETEDVFEEEEPKSLDKEQDEGGGWMEVSENDNGELPVEVERDEPVLDTTTHEPAVGKGLSGALQLLKERGTLKETVEWGGRNMDKKKSKLVGIYDEDATKEIRIERTDEFGRIMTPKEAFRMISHKFHGKGPGKMKMEKRQKQFFEELKLKQMKASDTPLLSMERMREAQAQTKSPYLVLSGHVKPGQTSDPRSGFATVEKDHPGSLTPMLGDRKVEHFLGLKRKAEPTDMGPPKKPKI